MKIVSQAGKSQLVKNLVNRLGVGFVEVEQGFFPNGETKLRIKGIEKGEVAILFYSSPGNVGKNLIDFMLLADAVRNFQPSKIIAVMPWLPFSPQDKRFRRGEPESAKVVVKLLEASPIDEFICIDLHSRLVEKMFVKPMHHISCMQIFLDYFQGKFDNSWVVVSLDKGAIERSRKFARALKLPVIQFDKFRDKTNGDVTINSIKGKVKGKNTISFDDFVSTGGTRIKAAKMIREFGGLKHYDCVTHVLVPETLEKIQKTSEIDGFFMTNTTEICLDRTKFPKVHEFDIALILKKALLASRD